MASPKFGGYKPAERNQRTVYEFTYDADGEPGSGIKKGDTYYQYGGVSNFGQGGTAVRDAQGNQVTRQHRGDAGYAGPPGQYSGADNTKAAYNYGYTMGGNSYTARGADGQPKQVTFDYIKNGKGSAGRQYDAAFMGGLMDGLGMGMMAGKENENKKKSRQRDIDMNRDRAESDYRRSEAAAYGRGEFPSEVSGSGSFGDSYNDGIDASMGEGMMGGLGDMGGMGGGGGGGGMDIDMAGADSWGGAWSSKKLKTAKRPAGDTVGGLRKMPERRGQGDNHPAAKVVREVNERLRAIDARLAKIGG